MNKLKKEFHKTFNIRGRDGVVSFDVDGLWQWIESKLKQKEEEVEERIFKTLKEDKETSNTLPHPVEAIKFVMEQRSLSPNNMVPYFGSLSKVFEVLNLKRPLSKKMIRRLMAGLDIPAEVLIQDYKLESLKENT